MAFTAPREPSMCGVLRIVDCLAALFASAEEPSAEKVLALVRGTAKFTAGNKEKRRPASGSTTTSSTTKCGRRGWTRSGSRSTM